MMTIITTHDLWFLLSFSVLIPFIQGVIPKKYSAFISVLLVFVAPHAGSGVVRIDLLCFLVGYRTRQLN